jgi:NitT/TauT family transport system substrate-binding protein
VLGALASGSAVLEAARSLEQAVAAVPVSQTPVRLGYLVNACEAATFVAPTSPSFRQNHLRPRLVRFADEDALIAALGAGAVDAASMKLAALLRPLEAGHDVRIVAGLHAGCLRVVAPDAASLLSLQDLKGKVVATDRFHGAAMNLLSAILRRQGIDPQGDVAWRVFSPVDLEPQLDSGDVACVAASDPLGYQLLTDKKAEPYLDSAGGGFSCGGDIAPGHHCFLVLPGRLVDRRGALAASIARAYLGATAAIRSGVGPAALAELRGGYAGADPYRTVGMLSSYDWSSSTELVLQEVELTARDFQRAGLLKPKTDPEALAERAFADVLGGA